MASVGQTWAHTVHAVHSEALIRGKPSSVLMIAGHHTLKHASHCVHRGSSTKYAVNSRYFISGSCWHGPWEITTAGAGCASALRMAPATCFRSHVSTVSTISTPVARHTPAMSSLGAALPWI